MAELLEKLNRVEVAINTVETLTEAAAHQACNGQGPVGNRNKNTVKTCDGDGDATPMAQQHPLAQQLSAEGRVRDEEGGYG